MLAFFLFIALTNLTLGIVLGYFYGPLFAPQRTAEAASAHGQHAPAQSSAPAAAHTPPAMPAIVKAAPAAETVTPPPAEDLRPVKPIGSREVTALDLADVMSELGVAPPAATLVQETKPAEAKPAAPAAPEITFEALTGEPAPLAG